MCVSIPFSTIKRSKAVSSQKRCGTVSIPFSTIKSEPISDGAPIIFSFNSI